MRYFILTDLEGVAGVDSFTQTRTKAPAATEPGLRHVGRDVNACVEGIRSVDATAEVDVWDAHGSGGIFGSDIVGANYISHTERPFKNIGTYDALLFVGQHAMVGTPFAPLCHTYSSLHIAYYRLNGLFVGELGARAFVAGSFDVPTIFVAGDDKAAHEAQVLVPAIETAVVKWGKGLEAAEHRTNAEACQVIRDGAARAVQRMAESPPLKGLDPPYKLEIRYYDPFDRAKREKPGVTIVDDRTLIVEAASLADLNL